MAYKVIDGMLTAIAHNDVFRRSAARYGYSKADQRNSAEFWSKGSREATRRMRKVK